MRVLLIICLLCSFLLTAGAAETEEDPQISRSWDFGIGLGYGEQTNPFVGADDVPGYLTLDLAIYGERFFFDNGELGFTLSDTERLGINLLANYSSERIYYSYFNDLGLIRNFQESGQSTENITVIPADQLPQAGVSVGPPGAFTVLELPDRDFAINLGVEFLWNLPAGQLQVKLLQDVSGTHQGAQLNLDYSRSWQHGRWGFRPGVGLSWQSAQLIDYYYGLEYRDELFGFRYVGEASTHLSLGMLLSYRINNNLSYVTQYRHTWLGSEVRDSPLIDVNHTQAWFSGLFYRF
jgi:outer membrane protein